MTEIRFSSGLKPNKEKGSLSIPEKSASIKKIMEESTLDFKFEINLQRSCSIKIAETLWEKEEIKNKVVYFFKNSYNRYDEEETNSLRWNKLTKKVLIFLEELSLPVKLKNRLKNITKSLGLQIFNWTKYVTKILKFDIICAREMFWTHYGTIDKVKIFQNWLEKKQLESSQLFNMACIFCLEEYISSLWDEIPDEVKRSDFYTETIYTMPKYNLIAYWKKFLVDDKRQNFISSMATTERVRMEKLIMEGLEDYDYNERRFAWLYIFVKNSSAEENMFRVSVVEGLDLGVKYFWNKLNDEHLEDNIKFAIYTINAKREEPEYKEILIFIMSKFSVSTNIRLCVEEFFMLEMLLKNWPWDEFFIPVLDRTLERYENLIDKEFDNYEIKFFNLIHVIVYMMKDDFDLYKSIEGTRYQIILHEAWNKIPESVKFMVAGKRDWSIFSKLLNIHDISSLELIINYEGFRKGKFSKRNSLISCMKSLFVTLKSEQKFEIVERFVNKIGLDENDRKKLRVEFRFC